MLYRLLWRPGIKSLRAPIRLVSTAAVQLQSQIQQHDIGQLAKVWETALHSDHDTALSLRYEIYQRMRTAGFPIESDWSLAILSSIPPRNIRFADYQYAAEVLLRLKRWPDLHKFFTDLAPAQPTLWQQLFLWVLEHADNTLPVKFTLETLGVSCISMGIKLEDLAVNADQPIFKMLELLESRFSPQDIIEAMSIVSKGNMVMAAPLATSLLVTKCDLQMKSSPSPSPMSETGQPLKNDLAQMLWVWKSKRSVTTPTDLHVYMLYLIYQRLPHEALTVFDRWPTLHDPILSDAVLLAAAMDSDFSRLQQTFESIESDPSVVSKIGSRHYTTVIRALGYLGDANVLDEIYRQLIEKDPRLLSRGVFHALIQSHGVRGDLKRAREYYDAMMNRGIDPTENTFRLVLRAYKDAQDLKGALHFVGDEMITKHQFGLGNAELTLLLSLCATRHDLKSSEYIWKWGCSMCEPDQISWQARIHCYAQANHIQEAWRIFDELITIHKPTIDTVTSLLQCAARFKQGVYVEKALKMKQKLKLEGDAAWYVAVLQHHNRSFDLDGFEATMSEMRTAGVALNASHYALYTELLAKTKNFDTAKRLPSEMTRNRVPITHAFIGKHLRMLTAPGSSGPSTVSAERTAMQHINEGYFDPRAAMVPRGVIPVSNVKPVVRRLIKQKNLVSAKQLLDSLRIARATEKPRDSYQLWALYIELAHAARNHAVVDKLWDQFMRDLTKVFVLHEGSTAPGQPPVYKLSPRHRQSFWKEINFKLDSMANMGWDIAKYTQFPASLEEVGFELTRANWNMYIQGLLLLNDPVRAFEKAETLHNESRGVSRLTLAKLSMAVDDVDTRNYGKLGSKAQSLADRYRKE